MKTTSKIPFIAAGMLLIAVAVWLIYGSNARDTSGEQRSEADYARSIAAVEAHISSSEGENNYYSVFNRWNNASVPVPAQRYDIPAAKLSGGASYGKAQSEGYEGDVVYAAPKDVVTFDVDVAEQGLYEIWLDYYILPQTVLKPELRIDINGKNQYNEMNKLVLGMDWRPEADERKIDRFGDELTPKSVIVSSWKNEALADPNYFFAEPLKFQLNKGKNTIRMTLHEGHILLGRIELKNTDASNVTYEQYLASTTGAKEAVDRLVTIEAEHVSLKNRQSIRSKYVRDPQITPYAYKHRVLNVLDGYSFGDSGDKVSYRFSIEESGFYYVTLKYSQDTNNGMPTHRKIEIDGNVPFKQLENYSFGYSSNWRNETLHDDKGEPFRIYLEQGEHTVTLSIDNTSVKEVYHELLKTLEAIDATAQEINRLTGGLVDKKRKWKIEKYIPNISTYLVGIAGKIEQQKVALIELTGNKDLPVITELSIAEGLVREFIQDPEELPHYMNKFNEGQSSAYGKIKTILPMLVYNPMHLDKIYFHSGGELPAANAGLLTRAVENTKAFLYSFVNPRYASAAGMDDNTVEIWVNQSRLYVEIMQRMIDEEFTPETGIKVKLSLLPDENKIVLSNAAGSTPDAALGVSHGRPFELALRGIIENLRTFDGFYELAEEYDPSAFVPFIYDEGVYAFPETQDVKLLFYRKDTMEFLGEEPPQTWDDVVSLVPVLQKYNMNFYTPLGSDNAFKGFDVTTPFIYQFGGRLYDESGSKVVINKEGAYKAFEFMTDLFTVYNIPITTSEFFQSFRNGKTPVGIGDANMYIQLKHAAPELAGQWGVLPIPGVMNDEGIIERWDPTYGSASIIFKGSDKKQEAWKFIKWWASADTQSDFSYNIQATLGEKFLYMTANLKGFAKSAWPSDSKDVILEQWKWIQATGKVPGDYVLEREISNAWNQVVFSKQNPRIAIDNAVKTINRELERKLTEFGYIEKGTLIRPYVVPTIENVKNWVRINGN
ncbi:extracellular solute-binding protein [Paenibacillus thermotolerans]|uniref:extracellular solute-binding protein n=1 Tax=Paenibacillus thermotolerans TaxID=3027807 RepID=UPI002368261C|nr:MULTISPECIES: extracellular solute-binding protein [unclassified Paenibacillus]